jgi:plastocyanin
MRRVRRAAALAAVLVLVGTACSDDKSDGADATSSTTAKPAAPAGPQTYNVVVDGPSTLHAENFALGLYFPKSLSVRPGDSVTFENRGVSDPHTISFGLKADRSDSPPLIIAGGSGNPAVFGPCFTAAPPKADMTSCPPPVSGTPEFTGSGFWNSGVILPTSLPAEAGPKTVTVKVGSSTAPGTYTITCLLHRFMESTLQVVASDAERQSPADVSAAADRELGAAKANASGQAPPATPATADGAAVAASWGDNTVGVNQFSPETVSIKVGQTVTWTDHSSWLPHTVSFNPPFASEAEPHALAPTGAKSGSKFGGGVAHSGIFGPSPPLPTDKFSLTFTKAGTYPYRCLLHPGMAGTVQVT